MLLPDLSALSIGCKGCEGDIEYVATSFQLLSIQMYVKRSKDTLEMIQRFMDMKKQEEDYLLTDVVGEDPQSTEGKYALLRDKQLTIEEAAETVDIGASIARECNRLKEDLEFMQGEVVDKISKQHVENRTSPSIVSRVYKENLETINKNLTLSRDTVSSILRAMGEKKDKEDEFVSKMLSEDGKPVFEKLQEADGNIEKAAETTDKYMFLKSEFKALERYLGYIQKGFVNKACDPEQHVSPSASKRAKRDDGAC